MDMTAYYANRFAALDGIVAALPPALGAQSESGDCPGNDPLIRAYDLDNTGDYLLIGLAESDADEAPATGQAYRCDYDGNPYLIEELADVTDAAAVAAAVQRLVKPKVWTVGGDVAYFLRGDDRLGYTILGHDGEPVWAEARFADDAEPGFEDEHDAAEKALRAFHAAVPALVEAL